MIKRYLSLLLVFCLLLGCVACGTNKPANKAGEETMKVNEAIDADGAIGKIDVDDAAIDSDEMKRYKYIETKKIDDDAAIDAEGKKRIDADDAAIDSDGKLPIGSDNAAIDSDEKLSKRKGYYKDYK